MGLTLPLPLLLIKIRKNEIMIGQLNNKQKEIWSTLGKEEAFSI